jgi:DNA repair protein RadD
LLRPTMSTSLYLQQVGRALRISPETGKTTALVLDHVNNYQRHGMPDDQREWSLSGGLTKKRKTEQSTESIMRCPKCFFAHSKALSCPNCGYTYTTKEKQIQEVAGELVLIGSQEYKNARQRETLNVSSLDELVKIEKDRGYKFGFAERQWQLKTGENLWSNVSGLEKIAKARGYSDSWVWVQKNKVRNKR